ncbi:MULTISPECIES: helix-turn-helix domain-containing protein [unclassified Streptomyces]|uniref:helix-turn-helix domain-containing protein n=1 Tax=unclassified Streptomyces TaxID=2593676 RepID=UPI0019CFC36A|nr:MULTISPECIES: helix-turn-helix domain-containing protein [unclassified Streptomyces]
MSALPRLHTPEEVAEALGVSVWWVKDQARRRLIPASKPAGAWRFTTAQYAEILTAVEQPVATPALPRSTRSTARPYYADSTAPVAQLTPRTPRRRAA